MAGVTRPDKPISFDMGTHGEVAGDLLLKVLQRDRINRTRFYPILPRLLGDTSESRTEENERESEGVKEGGKKGESEGKKEGGRKSQREGGKRLSLIFSGQVVHGP